MKTDTKLTLHHKGKILLFNLSRYSKITEIQLVLLHLYLYHILELIFPLSEIKKMFHQPNDPSLLDTVVFGLVKGNKNNFNVGLII